MNYQLHYDNLIKTRRHRVSEDGIYYENHHIVMKSMGGTDDPENLVKLTAREHFLAHWLLWRIHRNKQAAYAFNAFTRFFTGKNFADRPKITSARAYAEAREAYSKMHSERMKTRTITDTFRKNVAAARTGAHHTEATRKKMSDKKMGVKQGPISPTRSAALKEYFRTHKTEDVEKICLVCRETFTVKVWNLSECCSRACGSKRRRSRVKVIAIDRITGIEREFPSIRQACIELKIDKHRITMNDHKEYIFKTESK